MTLTTRAKAGNGEGAVVREYDKDGNAIGWKCQWTLKDASDNAIRNANGNVARPLVRGKTKQEVQLKRDKLKREAAAGKGLQAKPIMVPEVVERYINEACRTYSRKTVSNYRGSLKNYIKPLLNIRVESLNRDRLDRFFNETIAAATGSPIRTSAGGQATVVNAHGLLKAALRWAIALDTPPITRNPMEGQKFNFGKKRRRDMMPEAHLDRLLEATKGTPTGLAWHILSETGVRRSELLGLRVGDIDFDLGRIRIWLTADAVSEGKQVRQRTKAGELVERWLPVLDEALLAGLAAAVAGRPGHEPLIRGPKGGQMLYSTFTNYWNRDLKKAGLPHYNPHQIRHTFATQALDDGPANVVSEMLGHGDPATTLRMYAHTSDDRKYALMEAMKARKARLVAQKIANESMEQPSMPTEQRDREAS